MSIGGGCRAPSVLFVDVGSTRLGFRFPEQAELADEPVGCGATRAEEGNAQGVEVGSTDSAGELLEGSRGDEEGRSVADELLSEVAVIDSGEH